MDVAVKLIACLLRRPQTFRRVIAVASRFVHDTPIRPGMLFLIGKGALIERRNLSKIDHIAKITLPGDWGGCARNVVAAQRASAKGYTPCQEFENI
jgi:hypothetical protein